MNKIIEKIELLKKQISLKQDELEKEVRKRDIMRDTVYPKDKKVIITQELIDLRADFNILNQSIKDLSAEIREIKKDEENEKKLFSAIRYIDYQKEEFKNAKSILVINTESPNNNEIEISYVDKIEKSTKIENVLNAKVDLDTLKELIENSDILIGEEKKPFEKFLEYHTNDVIENKKKVTIKHIYRGVFKDISNFLSINATFQKLGYEEIEDEPYATKMLRLYGVAIDEKIMDKKIIKENKKKKKNILKK